MAPLVKMLAANPQNPREKERPDSYKLSQDLHMHALAPVYPQTQYT